MPQTRQERAMMANLNSNGSVLVPRQQNIAIPQHQKNSFIKRFKNFNKVEKERSEENQRIKSFERAEQEKRDRERISTLKDAQDRERIAMQALKDLKQDKISIQQYNKVISGEVDEKPVSKTKIVHVAGDEETAKLKKREDQHKRDVERFTSPSKLFPGGAEHKRRDPFTGRPTSKLTKTELIKNENFAGFVDGKPVFKEHEPEKENKLDFSAKSKEEVEEIAKDDDHEKSDHAILASPFLAKEEDE